MCKFTGTANRLGLRATEKSLEPKRKRQMGKFKDIVTNEMTTKNVDFETALIKLNVLFALNSLLRKMQQRGINHALINSTK